MQVAYKLQLEHCAINPLCFQKWGVFGGSAENAIHKMYLPPPKIPRILCPRQKFQWDFGIFGGGSCLFSGISGGGRVFNGCHSQHSRQEVPFLFSRHSESDDPHWHKHLDLCAPLHPQSSLVVFFPRGQYIPIHVFMQHFFFIVWLILVWTFEVSHHQWDDTLNKWFQILYFNGIF